MKQGDLVKFVNENHTSYQWLRKEVGIVLNIDETARWRRGRLDQHLGAAVMVSFGQRKPVACSESNLEVISGS